MSEFFDVELKHVGGMEIVMPVEFVAANGAYVSVHWGQSGFYDLVIKTNMLVARSVNARRRGATNWGAKDIQIVKRDVKKWLDAKAGRALEDMRRSIAEHERSKPGAT